MSLYCWALAFREVSQPWYNANLSYQKVPTMQITSSEPSSSSLSKLTKRTQLSPRSAQHVGLVSHGRGAAWTILDIESFAPGQATPKLRRRIQVGFLMSSPTIAREPADFQNVN